MIKIKLINKHNLKINYFFKIKRIFNKILLIKIKKLINNRKFSLKMIINLQIHKINNQQQIFMIKQI